MHTTRVVRHEQKSDEAIAVTIRCCEDPNTDSAVTIYDVANMTQTQIEEQVSKHHDRVAAKCGGMQRAKQHLAELLTTTKVHA